MVKPGDHVVYRYTGSDVGKSNKLVNFGDRGVVIKEVPPNGQTIHPAHGNPVHRRGVWHVLFPEAGMAMVATRWLEVVTPVDSKGWTGD